LNGSSADRSSRAVALVEQLREACDALIAIVERIEPERWVHVPKPGMWSPSKDAEHVAEGAAYHQWIVRLTLGQKVPARPGIERKLVTAQLSQREVVDLLRQRTEGGTHLVEGLSDEQLDLPPRPPRARLRTLAEMIERVLIGHYHTHRKVIESKLRAARSSPTLDFDRLATGRQTGDLAFVEAPGVEQTKMGRRSERRRTIRSAEPAP